MRNHLLPWRIDAFWRGLFLLAAACSASVFLLVFVFLLHESAPALQQPGVEAFFQDDSWHPTSQHFGMLPMLFATLATTLGAIFLAVPLGLGAAIFRRFYAPRWLAPIFHRLIEVLAGIPSVIFGLWGLLMVVPAIAQTWGGPGQSLLAAILVLALMILPTVTLTADAALARVPGSILMGATALGLQPGAVIMRVALPAARSGIQSGILLAVARGIGETMAVMMVAGNKVQAPWNLLLPVRTLSSNIALELGYASEAHRAALFFGGLLLVSTVLLFLLPQWCWPRRKSR